MRKRYIQHPETLELVPAEEYGSPRALGPMILPDIQPYQSMKTGEMIMGRRQHREHLRQHGLIEIGNEKIQPRKPQYPTAESVRADVIKAFQQHGK